MLNLQTLISQTTGPNLSCACRTELRDAFFEFEAPKNRIDSHATCAIHAKFNRIHELEKSTPTAADADALKLGIVALELALFVCFAGLMATMTMLRGDSIGSNAGTSVVLS